MRYDVDEECWLRVVRRNMLLLCIIYYLNLMLKSVTEKEIRNFLNFLEKTNPEKPLEYTLYELKKNEFIVIDDKIKVNKEKIKSEEDLMYWESVGNKIEEAFKKYTLTIEIKN